MRIRIVSTFPGASSYQAWNAFTDWHARHLGKVNPDVAEQVGKVNLEPSLAPGFAGHVQLANALDFVVPGYDATIVLWNPGNARWVAQAWLDPRFGIVCAVPFTGSPKLLADIVRHEYLHGLHRKAAHLGLKTADTLDADGGARKPGKHLARNLKELKPHRNALLAPLPEPKTAPQSPEKPEGAPGVLSALYAALRGAHAALAKLAGKPQIPSGYAEIVAKYGDPSDPDFEKRNIVLFDLPYPLLYEGKKVFRSRAHRLAVPQFVRALTLIRERGLAGEVRSYAGIYAPRPVRGGTKPSTHTWGIAGDFEADRFKLGSAARMRPEVVACFAEAGFTYGGDFPGRPDPMHFQLARDY